ncbi:MAG: hypothetical protein CL477_13455 [Acidobacteria bacterium]|jgi:hypothetical protein|nr:hypothetical protein [Acidobacteriota bacterium]MDP7690523.1 hypothetical protein [Vicinamibacterales bacterium]HJN46055.1 DUF6644 family protein [Vicinamibacterales bacterium]|tara:strand:- start:100 stop:579 length:480 start_codon:yes stop_codon:yes gene_type:complete
MSAQPFFEWMGGLRFSAFFLESVWPTPIVQCIHLVSVAVFVGALLLVDLRLLGRGLKETPLPQVARAAEPWLLGSFAVLVLTGIPQMSSTALKQYYSPFFWWKMEMLLLGVILTVTIRRKMASTEESQLGPVWPKVVALTSIALWTSVTIGARLIGLLS